MTQVTKLVVQHKSDENGKAIRGGKETRRIAAFYLDGTVKDHVGDIWEVKYMGDHYITLK